jgi:hypothetical protein
MSAAEIEIKKIARYLKYPIEGKLGYTDDNIIQLQINKEQKITGYSTIINYFHNEFTPKNDVSVQDFYRTKQFFDFANIFIRSTSKRDKCNLIKLIIFFFLLNLYFKIFFSCCLFGIE